MGISQQFSGLPMKDLIGSPLAAAADASINLANSTADFINRVGFDKDGKVRNVAFQYEKFSKNDDGTMNLDAMKVDVPMLAIVPIPNLQVDEVNVLFDMEVKESEKEEKNLDVGGSISGKANFGLFSVSVTGSVSVHETNTRSTDNSAKYHVDVRATNHGTPEGLARVLDMMAANVAPSLVGSTLKDENGQSLSGEAKARAEQLKALRAEIAALEKKVNAGRSALDTGMIDMKRQADSQVEIYRIQLNKLSDATNVGQLLTELKNLKKESAGNPEKAGEISEKQAAYDKASAEAAAITQLMNELEQSWATAMNLMATNVVTISESTEDTTGGVSLIWGFRGLNAEKTALANYDNASEDNSKYQAILAAQNNVVDKQRALKKAEDELLAKKQEYDTAIMK